MTKPIPFAVDRNDERTLLGQVVDGFRGAIIDGYYTAGDILPSSYTLVHALGVSRIVTRAAFRKLSDEGFVIARPRVGTMVNARKAKRWRGHVAFICPDREVGYFQTLFVDEIRNVLNEAGYHFTCAGVRMKPDRSCDFSILDAMLSRSVSLAVSIYDRPQIASYLLRRGIPFVTVCERVDTAAGSKGFTMFDHNLATAEFAAACASAGVGEVVQVGWLREEICDASSALKAVGIRSTKICLDPDLSTPMLAAVERTGYDAFRRMVADGRLGRAQRPDTVYFISDDYLARGALTAILQAGLRIPEDVRLAVWANKGLGPVYSRQFSRMEMDPSEAGRTVADAVLGYLRDGEYPSGTVIGPKWIRGETF